MRPAARRASPRRARGLGAAFVAFLALAASVVLPSPAAFADVDVELRVGHGGGWVQDAATPLVVDLRGSGGESVQVRMEVRGSDLTGRDEVVHERTVLLAPGVTRREVFLVPGGESYGSGARVSLRTTPPVPIRSRSKTGDKGRLDVAIEQGAAYENVVSSFESHVVGVVNDRRNVLRTVLPHAVRPSLVGQMVVETADRIDVMPVSPEALALGPLGLQGIEILVVCDPDSSFASDPRDAEALLDWVALGGRLVVSLGENAAQFPASPLAAELPARWLGADVGDALGLAEALGAPHPADPVTRPAARIRLSPDERAAPSGNVFPADLFAWRRYGSGAVAVLGCDVRTVLEVLPRTRESVRPVLDALLFEDAVRGERAVGQTWDPTYDVSTGLGRLLQGTAFTPPPLPLVLMGLVAYVLVVGPLDWFILRRMRKERWTTFTFAGAVLAFTFVAYGLSLLLFSSDAVVNRVAFFQFAAGGREGRELVRVHDLAGHYAPVGGTRTCRWPLPASVVGSTLPGLPESGGVGAKHAVLVEGSDPAAPVATVDVAFRSQRIVSSVVAGATGRTVDVRATLAKSVLRVEVENGLPTDLADAWLLLPGGRGMELGRVGSGETGAFTGKPEDLAGCDWSRYTSFPEDVGDAESMRRWLRRIVASASIAAERPSGFHALRRAGIVAPPPPTGRAVLVAFAEAPPVPLPGDDLGGVRFHVVTKEVELR